MEFNKIQIIMFLLLLTGCEIRTAILNPTQTPLNPTHLTVKARVPTEEPNPTLLSKLGG